MFFQKLLASVAAISALVPNAHAWLSRVNDFGSNPTGLQMNIYVPRKLAPNPAIILALHPCLMSGELYILMTDYVSLSEKLGFIAIYPTATKDSHCWDVNSKASLTHGGGGDSNGLVNMVQYTIDKYNANPKQVFVTGSSSGCMMTNVLAATYPDVFAAATCYSGVAAGCLAGAPGSSPFDSNPKCAAGEVNFTGEQYVEIVHGMYPGYNGTYPRFATFHGTADSIVNYANLGEQIKEWSTIFGVSLTKSNINNPQTGYTQMVYGDGSKFVAYSAKGVGHTVPVHSDLDLQWFGIA